MDYTLAKQLKLEKVKAWQKANPDKVRETRRKTQWKIKNDTLKVYSVPNRDGTVTPHCACCGEKEVKFLCIDHVENNGASHRKSIACHTGAGSFYYWLKRNKWPSGYQVLCTNCNLAKSVYKICPHQE